MTLRALGAPRRGETLLSLEAVAQTDGHSLVVVALAPYGPSLFRLRQTGRELSVEGVASRELGPVPLWVADALHRIYWIRPPSGSPPESSASWEREGEVVRDQRRDGRLYREFSRSGAAADSEAVSVEYPAAGGPPVIEIHNPRCGYDATVVTLEQSAGEDR